MGILSEPIAMIRALELPPNFSVCELGDQWVTCFDPHMLAEEFYLSMGCRRYVSIDGNGRGTIAHDLNLGIPPALAAERFNLVTDFGTGEHIFDQSCVWRTLHGLVHVGGYIAFDRPSQGYSEHCYYNSHECLFNDIAEANEYNVMFFERGKTIRGELLRGVFQKTKREKFVIPQQGRYRKSLAPIIKKELR